MHLLRSDVIDGGLLHLLSRLWIAGIVMSRLHFIINIFNEKTASCVLDFTYFRSSYYPGCLYARL